jgi:D-methionine transport system permease protein
VIDTIQRIWPELSKALVETGYMVGISMLAAVLFGVPLGILLHLTDQGNLNANRWVHGLVGWVVNIVRSFPYIILLVALIPLTRILVGTTIGPTAAVVSLTIAAIPFFGRLVEQSLREVPRGVVEMAVAQGASTRQVITKVLLPEAMPGLVSSTTVTAVAFIAFTAMAGAVGGGGIGDLAIRYGYYRFQTDVMVLCVVLLIIIVQIVQFVGDRITRAVDRR